MLAKAPHLAKLSAPVMSDPHLEKTQELLSVFSPQMFKTSLSTRHSLLWSGIHSLRPSGARFFSTLMSILKNSLHLWRRVMATTMIQKILEQAMHLSKRIKLSRSAQFVQKPIEFEFSVLGLWVWLFSFLIGRMNFETMRRSVWTYFELLHQIRWSPSCLTSKFMTSIQESLFISMTEQSLIPCFLLRCCHPVR